MDESCWVYVNGKQAGSFRYDAKKDPESWKKPLTFDITPFIEPGKPNHFAVRVHDQSFAGGIWRLVFPIFGKAGDDGPKAILSEGFEGSQVLWKRRGRPGGRNYEIAVTADDAYEGKQCMRIRILGGQPDLASVRWVAKSAEPGASYSFSLAYRIIRAEENTHMKARWQRRPGLPSARIVFHDAKGKNITSVKQYIWANGPFREKTDGWQDLKRVFVAPPGAKMISIPIFFAAKGEYLMDALEVQRM